MSDEVNIDIRASNYTHDCHMSYRLSLFELQNGDILKEIIARMRYEMANFILMKKREN